MSELVAIYSPAFTACVVLAWLFLVQVLVADFAGIRVKHVPGMPVVEGHKSFHFRAVRALANTNETIAMFLLLFALALLLQATAAWVNLLVPLYVAARAAHMLSYYARQGYARMAAFTVSLVAQAGLLFVCTAALLR